MIPMARPRIVVDGGEIFYVFRDEERGSKVSLAHATDVANSKWSISDLTDFTVGAWEPSHDTELWKSRKRLHLFVQHAKQGDGERVVEFAPQSVLVYENDMLIFIGFGFLLGTVLMHRSAAETGRSD